MKKLIPYLIILVLSVGLGVSLYTNLKPVPKSNLELYNARKDTIEMLRKGQYTIQLLKDSLKKKDAYLVKERIVYKVIEKQREDSVKSLPQSEKVKYFAEKTGTDSIPILPDSTALVQPYTIDSAVMLIVQGENAKRDVLRLESIVDVKDQRINADSALLESKTKENGLLRVNNNDIEKSNRQKDKIIHKQKIKQAVTVGVAVLVEILTVVLLLKP